MSEDDYEPGAAERRVASTLDQIIEDLLCGKIAGLGVCGYKRDGTPIYFFIDGTPPERGLLFPVMNKLAGIYTQRASFVGNAPEQNRSYGIH